MAWYVDPATGKGRLSVTHADETTGKEPTLRDYFFERVRPIVEKALAENDRAHWPLIVVHFDFKSNQAPLLHARLGPAGRIPGLDHDRGEDRRSAPSFAIRTQAAAGTHGGCRTSRRRSSSTKCRWVRSCGCSARPTRRRFPRSRRPSTSSCWRHCRREELLPERPTNYRRWWNNSWHEVEEGGQREAGDVDGGGRPAAAGAGRLCAQAGLLDPVLHTGRIYAGGEQGLGQGL